MANATLETIYAAIKDLAYTSYAVAPQSHWNTFPRIVIQEISQVPVQHINGTLPLRECQVTVSIYDTDFAALRTLSDNVAAAITALDQIWLDSVDNSLDDRGDGSTLNINRTTQTYTLFTGAN